jgi:beta-lactamase class A
MQRQLLFFISKGTVCMLLIVVACTMLAQPAFAMPKKHARVNSILNAEVYDVSRGRYLNYYGSQLFIMGSSFKVPIMLTFFNMIEQQGRGFSGQEWNLLTTMIENSNNDSASALLGEVGGASAVASYLQSIGVYGIYPDGNAWGYSQTSPYAMVRLLTRLYLGGIVSPYHRSLALSLMENVEADQRWGVGYTAPAGATVAMKNGWLPGPDGLWAVNTSGIVITGEDVYIISAYTMENPSFGAGISLVQSICGTVAQRLG